MKEQTFPGINLTKLTHDELSVILNRILESWTESETIPLTVAELITELTEQRETLHKVLSRKRHSDLTKTIVETDEFRDKAYRLLCKKIHHSLDEFETELVTAAESLMKIVKKFGVEIVEFSYAEQTSATERALSVFRTEENLSSIDILGLSKALERVDYYNQEFETVWNQRSSTRSASEKLPRMRYLRREIENRLRLLIEITEYLFTRNNATVSKQLFTSIDYELTKASAEIKRRATLKTNKQVLPAE